MLSLPSEANAKRYPVLRTTILSFMSHPSHIGLLAGSLDGLLLEATTCKQQLAPRITVPNQATVATDSAKAVLPTATPIRLNEKGR
jgi:hypothetical protein